MWTMDYLKTYQVRFPRGVHFGLGASEKVAEIAKAYGANRALVVTDRLLGPSGIIEKISQFLSRGGVQPVIYDGVVTEPTTQQVQEGLDVYKKENCDLLIALGGGSCLDAAKGIAVLATNGGRLQDYEGRAKVKKPKAPLIAIPTTAGTGSEVSWGAVITDTERKVKFIVHSPLNIPEEAIEDPLLTLSMPPGITASSGMDALTHAIEGFISMREANLGYGSLPLIHYLALPAIELISQNLRPAWANGRDIEARSNMLLGQLLAGFTFANNGTTLAHGMARPLGAYFHVPHGLANAICLPRVMEFTWVAAPDKFAQIARAMGEDVNGLPVNQAAQKAVEAIKKLAADIQIPKLRDLVKEEDFRRVVAQMAKDGLASGTPQVNPRVPTEKEIVELFNLVYS
jgi:alcohol dehydrogenase class IV